MAKRRECPKCRFEVEPGDTACPFCGVALAPAVPPPVKGRAGALNPCPDCGAAVSVRAELCPRCGCPSASGARRPERRVGRSLVRRGLLCFGLIVLFNRLGPPGPPAKAPPRIASGLAAGDRVVLDGKGGDGAYAAFGLEAWSRMARAQARRDAAELQRLADAGQIALLPDGTPAEVVGTATMMLQLRVLGGPHEGRAAWVRRESVRPAGR
jgi:RNA polymerase subunit RPABC4/transcription elongation factor Spt4